MSLAQSSYITCGARYNNSQLLLPIAFIYSTIVACNVRFNIYCAVLVMIMTVIGSICLLKVLVYKL